MAKTVIIGAGLTGIATAYYLEQAGYYDYILLEKETTVGGLCRSIAQDGFTFDYTGHLLHLNDPALRTLVTSLLPTDGFATIYRKAHIYSNDTYTQYPYQINLHGLPRDIIIECIEGFVQRTPTETTSLFRDWVLAEFGAGFARHFFFPYQQKLFDIDINELSSSWTSKFVPATSLRDMLNGALGNNVSNIGYNAQFLYPQQGGIITWIAALHAKLSRPAICSTEVIAINTIHKVVRCADGREETFDQIVSTMPLTVLLSKLLEKSSTHLATTIPFLRCNGIINFNLGVRYNPFPDTHWVYYPELTYPFYRIGFPAHLTSSMAPYGCSSLSGECSFLARDDQYIRNLTNTALRATYKLFNLTDNDIITQAIINIPHAYVIFDLWRDQHLPHILDTLATTYNIHSIGRYGAWKYASMQDALQDGKNMAQQIIHQRLRNTYATSQPSISQ